MANSTEEGQELSLPAGQFAIETTNLKKFRMFTELLLNTSKRYPTMGAATGVSGVGKTVAIDTFVSRQEPRTYTGLPGIIKVEVKPRSSSKTLAEQIVTALGYKPKGSNGPKLSDEAVRAIQSNSIDLLIVDEGDRLNDDSFEVLRDIYDRARCPILVVGLPDILRVIEKHEKFDSRVGLRMSFVKLDLEEALYTVLPQLVYPKWQFDSKNAADIEMGTQIWDRVKPSLRKLRDLLEIANQIAEIDDSPRITVDIVREASNWAAKRMKNEENSEIQNKNNQLGEHEERSEKRNAAKNRRKPQE
jgi:DNA transposition AAA+ family ATPase